MNLLPHVLSIRMHSVHTLQMSHFFQGPIHPHMASMFRIYYYHVNRSLPHLEAQQLMNIHRIQLSFKHVSWIYCTVPTYTCKPLYNRNATSALRKFKGTMNLVSMCLTLRIRLSIRTIITTPSHIISAGSLEACIIVSEVKIFHVHAFKKYAYKSVFSTNFSNRSRPNQHSL